MEYTVILLIFVIVILPWFFLIKPAKADPERTERFKRYRYAHRGLHSRDGSVPENSIAAFQLAAYKHYGIELDLQLTKDEQLVVFHDEDLMRMCGVSKKVSELSLEELKEYRLLESEEKIPLLSEVLGAVAGRVPLILDLKVTDADPDVLCEKTAEQLEKYEGLSCVQSFSPSVVKWFRRQAPKIVRGQLAMNFKKDKRMSLLMRFAAANLLLNWIGRPDFISYSYEGKNNPSLFVCRSFFKALTLAWTVNDTYYYQLVKRHFDTVIFEFIDPS